MSDMGDIRQSIAAIQALMMDSAEVRAQQSADIRSMKEGLDRHMEQEEKDIAAITEKLHAHDARLDKLEQLKYEARGFGKGLKAAMAIGVTAVIAAISYIIYMVTGVRIG